MPRESQPGESFGELLVRLCLLGGLGVVSGWLSFQAVAYAPVSEVHEEYWRFSPGAIYGLLWLILAWWPPRVMAVRDRHRRSLLWGAAFLVGMTLSYAAAYETTQLFFLKVSAHLPGMQGGSERPYLVPSGFVGGQVGGLGLVCVMGFLFRAFDRWAVRWILSAAGAFLGSLIAIWSPGNDEGDDFRLMLFFLIWQGGMAVTIGATDAWWRRSNRGEFAGS